MTSMTASGDIPLRCACGTLRGALHRPPGERATRVVCYCDDCRAFARFLDAAAPTLDADGGSDVFQVSPACLRFARGTERLAAMRLSPKGLIRWYADCCRTLVCNTPAAHRLPFAGVSTRFVHVPPERTLDALLGPAESGVQAGREHGVTAPWPVHAGVPLALILSSVRSVGGWRLRGDHRRSPLTDGTSGEPVVAPRVLSSEERAALDEAA